MTRDVTEKEVTLTIIVLKRVKAKIKIAGTVTDAFGTAWLVRREDAEKLFLDSAKRDPRHLRNYELEEWLDPDTVEGRRKFVINSWCPFNGVYCAWSAVAPETALLESIAQSTNGYEIAHLEGCLKRQTK